MKLRIRGDSLRLRLMRGEVDAMARAGAVEETIHFAPDAALVYRLEASDEVERPVATFDGRRLCVVLPRAAVAHWAGSDEVGIRAGQAIAGERQLTILVEKDFACLTPREDEDESDMYDHPGAADGASC